MRRTIATLFTVFAAVVTGSAAEITLLNVSYDPTRELYEEVNKLFAADYQARKGQEIRVQQSHSGSGKQARSVIDGLGADVVTLALGYDIDAIAARGGLIDKNWQKRLPNNSCPYTSTIVFLVRKGNPKQIKDWLDLARAGVSVITPNPKTSGGARWNYLAAYGYELKRAGNDKSARELVGKIFANVPIFDTGARGATITFVDRKIGDVLIAWENEAILAVETMAKGEVEIVYPSISIRAEPPVAVVDRNAKRRKTESAATDYLAFLYSPAGQEVIAKHHFRPHDKAVADKYKTKFPGVAMFTVDELFGGWDQAHKAHFAAGGTFDKTQARRRR